MNQERQKGIVYLVNKATDRGLIGHPDHPERHAFALSNTPPVKIGMTVSFVSKPQPGRTALWAEDVQPAA